MKLKLISLLIFCITINTNIFGQVSYHPPESKIYQYIERINIKGIIELDNYVKPLSRQYIAEKLNEIKNKRIKLTNLEREELEFYLREFGNELDTSETTYKGELNLLKSDKHNIWRILNFRNTNMYFDAAPIAGYEKGKWDDTDYSKLQLGVSLHGALGNILGFSFKLRQFRLVPGSIYLPFLFRFTKSTGVNPTLSDTPRIEYHYLDASMGTNWSWGSLSIGKGNTTFGHEKSGNIILSDRAASYPNIRLDLEPFEWLTFNYVLGWLNSNLYDSTAFYATFRYRQNSNTDRKNYIQKYLAIHSLTAQPFKGLFLTLGESVVYSKKFREEFTLPIFPFFLSDNDDEENINDNHQWFFSLSSKNHIPNTHIYANFLADDLSVSSSLDSSINYGKYALSIGLENADILLNNLTLTFEYTKIYPAVYRHYDPTVTFASSGFFRSFDYSLGHWAGDNTELFFGSLNYRIIRGLECTLWGQFINKGTEAIGARGYVSPQPTFLFADRPNQRKNYTYIGFDLNYEIFHYLHARVNFLSIEEAVKQTDGKYKSTKYRNIALNIGYGI